MTSSQPTFWIYLKQLFAHFSPENADLTAELEAILDHFGDAPTAIQHESWRRCFEILSEFPQAPMLAFQLGLNVPTTSFIPMAIPLRFAPTIRKMLWFTGRYYHLQAPLILLDYSESGDHGIVEIDFRLPVSEKVEAFSIAASACLLDCELSHITGHKKNIHQIHLRQLPQEYIEPYKQTLGITPAVNKPRNQLIISEKCLSSINPLADSITFEKYVEQYEAELADSYREDAVSALLRDLIYSHISNPPSLGEAATRLKLSERQLRFALNKEQTSYRELLQNCRTEYATQLLENPRTPISQIAYKLGYNDLAAFNHAFKRWTGTAPSEFQKKKNRHQ